MKQYHITVNPDSKNASKGTLTILERGYSLEYTGTRKDGTSYQSFDAVNSSDMVWEPKTKRAHYEKFWEQDDEICSRIVTFELGNEIPVQSDDDFRKSMGW